LLVTESENVAVEGNLLEGNDRSAVMAEYLFTGSSKITVSGNIIQYNNGFGIESYAVKDITAGGNTTAGNRSGEMNVSPEKIIIMN
jgi:parallel beta-helix repeat protein